MKIYNIKVKQIVSFLILLVIILILFFVFSSFAGSNNITMTNENYTTILKECHDDPYACSGKEISAEGYVFRARNFSRNQFVVARDMLINENESRIVGFLCEYEKASELEDNEWIRIQGKINVGDYYGAMPIIEIKKVERITTPTDVFVNPPTI